MKNILIVKTGASGDVVRTTILLRTLHGNLYWITDPYNFPLFPDNFKNLTLLSTDEDLAVIENIYFDHIINLEEDISLAQRVEQLKFRKLTGIFYHLGALSYTDDSASWFDMSLISHFGKARANHLKKINSKSYQQHLFEMLGFIFDDEQYCIFGREKKPDQKSAIAIESRAGERWPNKAWKGYAELSTCLQSDGYNVFTLGSREDLREYMYDIQCSSLLVTGDTLAMHLALAYGIPCIALFTCTSPVEIHPYHSLTKIVSPLLEQFFYDTAFSEEAVSAIPVQEVYKSLTAVLGS